MKDKKERKRELSREGKRARDWRYFLILMATFFVVAMFLPLLPQESSLLYYGVLFGLCFGGLYVADYIYDRFVLAKRQTQENKKPSPSGPPVKRKKKKRKK